jgi:phosphoribosylformimino-5-aminoimidazole carboxamide ribotide isomerase
LAFLEQATYLLRETLRYMRIIPAIDLFEGKCVRLTQREYDSLREYDSDPVSVANRYVEAGFNELHVVDLEGAKQGMIVNWPSIERILSNAKIAVQVGGGIRRQDEIVRLLKMGAARVVVASVPLSWPDTFQNWTSSFGPDKFCVAVDLKEGSLVTNAWRIKSNVSFDEQIEVLTELGIHTLLCTDISRDGTLQGPNTSLYRDLVKRFPRISWLASGGVQSTSEIRSLKDAGASGVVIGKAFYEGTLDLDEVAAEWGRALRMGVK